MKSLYTFLFLLTTVLLSAQNVTMQGDAVYVNRLEFLKIDDDLRKDLVMKPNNEIVFTIEDKSLSSVLPYRNDPRDPNNYNYPTTAIRSYYIVSFVNFDLKFETDIDKEDFFRILFKYNLFDKDGYVSQINAKTIAQLISKEITGKIPVVDLNN